jgi:glycosyltransferase involved in cell wall biosynthesis
MTKETDSSRLRQNYGEPRRSTSGSVESSARREVGSLLSEDDIENRGPRITERQSQIINQLSEISNQTPSSVIGHRTLRVALLTGGADKPYALGIAGALSTAGISLDFIGSNDLNLAELHNLPQLRFLNLRGDQSPEASLPIKIARVTIYYCRLICYAAIAKPKILHVLWNNKFELFDRTLLILYYKFLGKKIVLTAHNVNIRKRDCTDTWLNRFSLRAQYQLVDHIFVHTERMKQELLSDFGIQERKVSVIPFGINNTIPNTEMTTLHAKGVLGISTSDKTMLCYGQIAPYKGLEYLISAFTELLSRGGNYRLIIAGKPKWNEIYWNQVVQVMIDRGVRERVVERIEHVPDAETELYFKAADVLILPYRRIFQSGVLFLSYSFGLPVIAADVGSLKEEIIEGETGFVFKPQDSSHLATVIGQYFESELFRNLENRRGEIKAYANERYSWDKVAAITTAVYSELLRNP